MKKIFLVLLILSLIACSSESEIADDQVTTTSINIKSEESTNTTSVNTPEENTPIVEEYVFNVERMSALTGLEIAPELWLKRPRRVLAFKIDNNINARPQSGLQEADAVFELLVEGGMTRFLAFFHDKSSTYLGPC